VRGASTGLDGSSFELKVSHPLTTLRGGTLAPFVLPLEVNLLGMAQIGNAALAATAALVSGVPASTVASALAAVSPARRRLECIYRAGPIVLDDTVGNPASLDRALDMARSIPHRELRIVFSIRGSRGTAINERLATALATQTLALDSASATIIVTSSRDTADERNSVTEAEQNIVLFTLRRLGVAARYEPDLRGAIVAALADAARDDLVLLLGAQGMDAGAAMAREVLASAR
jgi:UDP-N-acetylmuramoyl-L-alanyl-D-glutamate--2,6-diaminopimelate ligase